MERRFKVRYEELMADAEVKPEALEGVLKRLRVFVQPFAGSLEYAEQRDHLQEYVAGLVSNVKRKNIETIAYLHEQDRQPLQKFIGQRPWEWQPMIGELAKQIGTSLGEADGVLVFDPSGVLKQGKASVGVARQWCGRAGKVDSCQVGIYMGSSLARNMPWSTRGCTCRRNGPRTRSVAGGQGFRRKFAFARDMNWPWKCFANTVSCCRTVG